MKLKWILFVGVFVKKKIKILYLGHLQYDRFKKNLKSNDFIHSILKALSNNVEGNSLSSMMNVCHYIAECCEDKFVSAAGDSGLNFFWLNIYY